MNIKGKDLLPAQLQADGKRIVNVPALKFYNPAYDDYWTLDLNEDMYFNSPSGSTVLVLAAGGTNSNLKGQWTLEDQDYSANNPAGDGGIVNVAHLKSFVLDALANLPAAAATKTVTDLYMDQTELVLQFNDGTRLRTDLSFLLLDYQITDNLREGNNPKNRWFTEVRVLATPLTGYTPATTSRPLAVTDTLSTALGLLEKRITDTTTTWFSPTSTITIPSSFSTFTLTPGVIHYLSSNSQVKLDTTRNASTTAPRNYNLTFPATTAGYAIIDFVNGATLDGKTRYVMYPGDWLIFMTASGNPALGTIIAAGNTLSLRGTQLPSTSTRGTVAAGTFVKGELQGTQPADSVVGQRFCDAQYRYEFMAGMNDVNGDQLTWVRLLKSM